MTYFPLRTPESQGIPSGAIVNFIKEADRHGLELHRLMIIRHGKCIAKGSYDPYTEEDLHPLFSFTKSFTAAAIGFAVQEGILSLDDPMVNFFPEEIPSLEELKELYLDMPHSNFPTESTAKTHEDMLANMNAVTIHHLLCMSCGHEEECPDRSETWISSFFRQPFLHKPGTFYKYNTMGSNLLSAILKKATGEDLTDYLRPRLFDPIGIKEVGNYHLDDPLHVQAGGSGFRLSLEDMARFTYFMLKDGYWDRKAILPNWYEKAARKQMETAGDSEGHIKDWACGYGYQCWMGTYPGSFRADGAFGQFGLVFPSLDLCIILSAATEQTQTLLDLINTCILPYVDQIEEEDYYGIQENQGLLADALTRLQLPALKGCRNPMWENMITGKTFSIHNEENLRCSGLKTLIGGGGIKSFSDDHDTMAMEFSFDNSTVIWKVIQKQRTNEDSEIFSSTICASLENRFLRSYDATADFEYVATARWRAHESLEMEIRRTDTMSGVRLLFRFIAEEERIRCSIEADETLITDGDFGTVKKEISAYFESK